MNHYRIADLIVAADLDLPFAEPAAAGASAPDVVIRRGDVPDAVGRPAAEGPCWAIDGDSCLMRVPGIVRCRVTGGREITFQTEGPAIDADAAPFALGAAFGVLLHQRGLMVLHAGSIEVGGRAVLFCGSSGAGKSTLVAALAARGYAVVADDVCIVDFPADGQPVVRSDGRFVRLWAGAVDALALHDHRRDRVRPSIEKFYVAPPRVAAGQRYPLGAAYSLRSDWRSGPPRLAPADAMTGVLALRRSAYRPRYVVAAGLQQQQFLDVTRLAARVAVTDLWRRLAFEALPATVDLLETHWRELGLLEQVS